MELSLFEIKKWLKDNNIKFTSNQKNNVFINTFSPLKELKSNSITWVRKLNDEIISSLNQVENILVIIDEDDTVKNDRFSFIAVHNPHKVFFQIIEEFFYKKPEIVFGKSSVIHTNRIGKNFSIGEFSYIGPDVEIGDDCVVGNNVSIENKVIIGNNVIIESGARIGTWGFGHYLNEDGTSTKIPHLGGVRIDNNVFIGANSIVARGTLSDTIIEEHAKIDVLCGICHNSRVGARTIITGGAGLAGSSEVDTDSWIGPGAIINASVKVGKNCLIGINSVVSHDVPDGMYAFGIPAKIISENKDKKYKI